MGIDVGLNVGKTVSTSLSLGVEGVSGEASGGRVANGGRVAV